MRKLCGGLCVATRGGSWLARTTLVLLVALVTLSSNCFAEEITIRLRLAWRSGDAAKHRWIGQITCAGATFSELQPLGLEADAPVAIQINDNKLVVNPREKRAFDGCDITVQGDSESLLRFELQSDQARVPTTVEVPLGKLVKEQVRESIDSLGTTVLAYRCPADRFRVLPTRENLIFSPGEVWPLRLKTDFAAEVAVGPVVVEIVLRGIGSENALWQSTQVITANTPAAEKIAFEVVCPTVEGAYRLSLSARNEEGFATRFVPGQGSKPFATREIDLVVVDPAAKLPQLADHWLPVLSIDPANPSWWQRFPTWAQVSRLTGRPPEALGNVRLLARTDDANGYVELPPSSNKQDPSWQAFTLPVLEVGVPHLVEIAYPRSERQHLGVSLIEPDAAGRVMSSVLDSGFYVDDVVEQAGAQPGVHRIVFWPRSRSPQLLIVNQHNSQPGVFGRITLSRHDDATSSLTELPAGESNTRMVAGYIAKPVFAQNLGAADVLDPASGMSVQSWSTFLDGARRLTQYLKLVGYNGAMISVAADGSALYPSESLRPSPRYDTGLLAASGQDPVRKDILEMLLRVCDREGVRVVPTLQMTAPLPRLEAAQNDDAAKAAGISWNKPNGPGVVDSRSDQSTNAVKYNLLDDRVQREVAAMVLEIVRRYGKHSSLTGIALQLDSRGYGVLQGLEWGLDDQTMAAFSADTGIELSTAGANRFQQRASLLSGEHRLAWQEWRVKKLTRFYAGLAQELQAQPSKLKLVLTTENLFADPAFEQSLRRTLTNPGRSAELLAERGIDLKQLAAIKGVEITSTSRLDSQEHVPADALETISNEAGTNRTASMVFHSSRQSRLASFDAISPYGAERTHLVLAHQSTPAGAAIHRPFLSALLGAELASVVEGGDYLPMTFDPAHRDYLRSLEQLPTNPQESRSLREQPLVLQVRRSGSETYLVCVNESPWAVAGQMELETAREIAWQKMGAGLESGKLAVGRSPWPLTVPAYGLQVWKFNDPGLRVGEWRVNTDRLVHDYLEWRIQEIETRTGNLNIARDYPQLQNPGFELDEGTARIFGWQPRKAALGAVELETSTIRSGARALRLKSEDPVGVAVQSHLFPLPATGMLVVGVQVRGEQVAEDARLAIAVETEENGQSYRRVQTFQSTALPNQWTPLEFAVSDLPVGDASQIRVQFHVTGAANVVLDDVTLCDLRFDDQRRSELVKRVFAAKTALEEDQVVDCLRLLNEYWSRYLVEYVPPLVREPALAKQPSDEAASEGKSKAKSRLRGLVPRIWR